MFFKNSEHVYKVNLPISTSKDVIEWFEEMSSQNKLSDELIALVYHSLKASENSIDKPIPAQTLQVIDITQKIEENKAISSGDDFLNNLYNWQDSCNAVFKDDKPKIEKKGMLFV